MKAVHWTEEERQIESDLGVAEIRQRMGKLDWPDRFEVIVSFRQPVMLTGSQAEIWAKLANSLPALGSAFSGERFLVDGSRIVRERSQDELAHLICIMERAKRYQSADEAAATPGRPAIVPEEGG